MPLPGADIVVGGFGGVRREMLYAMSPHSNTSALRVGDGGQMELSRGEIERGQLKRLWLFNLRVSTHCVCLAR